MNRDYLGDAFDHWKGSLISILCEHRRRLLNRLAVVPMATDALEWNQNDWQTYARLLNVGDICQQGVAFVNGARQRREYFDNLPKDRDLFLDPDKGITINGMRRTKKHVTIQELDRLLNGSNKSSRLLMVYQHAARVGRRGHLARIAGELRRDGRRVVVYDGRQVAMLFISRDTRRIQDIEKALREYLGRAGQERVWEARPECATMQAAVHEMAMYLSDEHCLRSSGFGV